MKRIAKKVLLIGWDAADWKFISPLMEEGLMPNLQKLTDGGVQGTLATLDPPFSPTLWTSIATGKRPYKHGIHGFTEVDPSGKGIRPIYNTNRKVKAIWNILTQNNLKSNVIGWWPSHPAEPINGTMVSNLYQRANGKLNEPWPMLKGTVYPDELKGILANLRVHPEELTEAHIQPFVPEYFKINQSVDKRLDSIAKITADCSTVQSAATYLMSSTDWDLTAVYFDAIDHYCHGFMKYHPPHRPHISKRDFNLFKDVVKGGCIYHDMMLGRLLEMVDEDTTVILVSDHGFHPDHNRPVRLPEEPAGPAFEHSPYGIIVMNGPGIKKDELLFGANLLDITPTLLRLFGLPTASDMDGKVLVNAFEEELDIEVINSWENIAGEDGSHPKDLKIDEDEMKVELTQLIELGYIEDFGDNVDAAMERTTNENNFNLARAYIDGGKWQEAANVLQQLHEAKPKEVRYTSKLSYALQHLGKYSEARKLIEKIREEFSNDNVQLDVLEGNILMVEGRYQQALELFRKAVKGVGNDSEINLRIGLALMELNDLEKAADAIKNSIEIEPEESRAHHLLGMVYHRMTEYDKAVESFMTSIGLMYDYPQAHYYLGETLFEMGKYKEAAHAYKVTLSLAPQLSIARIKLISIYNDYLKDSQEAFKYQTDLENKIIGELTIVSGLPRSGTSMMMQMLEAGGNEIFTDKERAADESNPKGYYEHEAIKNTAKNRKWVAKATGKTVKVIAHLLKYLPMRYRYKVIFMERDIVEVVHSQQKMLIRDGKKTREDTMPLSLMESYQRTIEEVKKWAAERPNVEIKFVAHKDVIQNPFMQAMFVNDFLGGHLQAELMAAQVDAALYREKSEKSAV